MGEWTPQLYQLGTAVVVVVALARWLWGLEHDFVKVYASRLAALEAETARLRAEVDHWREEYWTLRRWWSDGTGPPPPLPARFPPPPEGGP